MTMSSAPTPDSPGEPTPEIRGDAPEQLMDYLRNQFVAAHAKEQAEAEAEETPDNGSFWTQINLTEHTDDFVFEGATRVVMAPPIQVGSRAVAPEYAEVYAVLLRSTDGHMQSDAPGIFADQFLVRVFSDGCSSPTKLVTEVGVTDADLSDFDGVAGFGSDEEREQSIGEQVDAVFRPVVEAQRLFVRLRRYNIVASRD